MHVPRLRVRFTLFSLPILLGSILLFALGCRAAPAPAPPPTPAASAPRTTTLTLWHTFTGDRRETLEAMARDFHDTYPDLTVQPVYVGTRDDLTKQMNAAIALGSQPDMVLADRAQLADFARQDGLQPLEPFINDTELGLSADDKSDFLHGALNLGKYPTLADRTYGFPFDQESFVLFYNADLLKSINVNNAPRTWEDFADYSGTITKDETYGWAMRADAATFEAMLVSRGSALLTDAETRALFNERAGLNSLKLVADMNGGGVAALATSDDKARREFASGNAAFYMSWMSEYDILQGLQQEEKTNFQIGMGPLPQLDAQDPWLLTRGDLFGISAAAPGSSDPQRARNAWFFIRWITAPTQSARWVRAANSIPLRASALTFISPNQNTSTHFREIASAFSGALPSLAPQPASPYYVTIEQQIGGLWLQAVQPKADLAGILDAAAARINQILAVKL